MNNAQFSAEIVMPDARRVPFGTRQNNQFVGSYSGADVAGDYTVVVSARHDGKDLGTTQSRFLVYENDLELENPAADAPLLQSLASVTHRDRDGPRAIGQLL